MEEPRNNTAETCTSRRERLSMDMDWRFHCGDIDVLLPQTHFETYMSVKAGYASGPAGVDWDDSNWARVDLPHDWSVEGEFDPDGNLNHGYLPTGISWYRKTFVIPSEDDGKSLWLEFDGVFRNSTIWMNGHRIGNHISGYTGFRLDISDVANYGGLNVLSVKVDATEFEGWWYEGAGIYRHVWLVKANKLHVSPAGVFVRSDCHTDADKIIADLSIEINILNYTEDVAEGELVSTVTNPDGAPIVSAVTSFCADALSEKVCSQKLTVREPILWNVDEPYLYKVKTAIMVDNHVIDDIETSFGIRMIEFDPENGFFLNGQPLKLKGTCNHQDHAGLGVALPDRTHEYRIGKLKEMSSNAYRCAHNAPATEFLDACDRLGMLVIVENRHLDSSTEGISDLEWTIKRFRNHPSIIMWCLANEEPLQGTDVGLRLARSMNSVAHKLDPTRPTTCAMNGSWGSAFSLVHDVQGCNYVIDQFDSYHELHPSHPMLATELTSALSTRGVYSNDDLQCYMSAYDVNFPGWGSTAEQGWKAVAERPYVSGIFVWTGFDYRGEPTPYRWPCVSSHFGIMDSCGFPKDTYYYYKAWWGNDPVLHLFPHWNWPGYEGKNISVWCHSNCDEVELFINGNSLGKKSVEKFSHLEWSVPYEPGSLVADGYIGGKLIISNTVQTTNQPARILLVPDKPSIDADGRDISLLAVCIVDENELVVPTADNEISFSLQGDAKIIGVGNGNPSSHEPDKGSARKAFNGLCQCIVQAGQSPGTITIMAESPGLETAILCLQSEPVIPMPFVQSVNRDANLITWRRSPILINEPEGTISPADYDQNSWETVHLGDPQAQSTVEGTGYVVYRSDIVVPAFDNDAEILVADVKGIIGKSSIYINGCLATKTTNAEISLSLSDMSPQCQITISIVVELAEGCSGLAGPVVLNKYPKSLGELS